VKWDDEIADRIAAVNLFLDESRDRRKAALAELRERVGVCTPGAGFSHVENALRGEWIMACERGRAKVTITLAPTMPPKVQFFSVSAVPAAESGVRSGTCQ
jgi:hypothetical protein